jgi:hypothetical protein
MLRIVLILLSTMTSNHKQLPLFFPPKMYAIRTYMYILYGELMGVDGSKQRIEYNEIDNRSENDSPYFGRKYRRNLPRLTHRSPPTPSFLFSTKVGFTRSITIIPILKLSDCNENQLAMTYYFFSSKLFACDITLFIRLCILTFLKKNIVYKFSRRLFIFTKRNF